ncbi:xanthine dehydrogenase family protein molybdopterin-binding subunit [Candidatus Poriferisocius sp.]|uniref:xanthine dehydrogenase family protein molybdopterin-binding subunit n=1 Tax=Candidatus Poriferisocius sp. TaxID=3101276 RepID=UPI003B024881
MTGQDRDLGIGGSPRRVEDQALLTGEARFSGDVAVEGLLYAAFCRSHYPFAQISAIDTSWAAASPGVVAVFCAGDLDLDPVSPPGMDQMLSEFWLRPALARDVVRFVGEAVAVVIADSQANAIDAAALIEVDYAPLPHIIDPGEAARPGALAIHPEAGTNIVIDQHLAAGQESGTHTTVRARLGNHRMAGAPMEGASVTVEVAGEHTLTLWAATQMPHMVRDGLARHLGLEPEQIRVVSTNVGGSFGGKTTAIPEYVIAAASALRLRRPVRWVQSRTENLLEMHARSQVFDISLSADDQGRITSFGVDALADLGAYPGVNLGIAATTRRLSPGPYKIPHVDYRHRGVCTNTAPVGAFRGAGRPEAAGLIERSIDLLANRLGIDPVEFRRRNLIEMDAFPYDNLVGTIYDTGNYVAALDEAASLIGYEALRREQQHRREGSARRQIGIGVACYIELSASVPGFNSDNASLEIDLDGRFQVRVGTAAHGQGHHTVYAQIVSEVFGIEPAIVTVVDADTASVARGRGTGSSRSAQIGGSAVLNAAHAVFSQATGLAAEMLEASPADITPDRSGLGLCLRGSPSSAVNWKELAEFANRPGLGNPGLAAAPGFKQTKDGTVSFGSHIAVVEIDTETGAVGLRQIVAVDDCGTILNPMLAEGQVHGGMLGGIAQALFEEMLYDDDGNPLTTTFADYAFPSAAEFPSFQTAHTVTPTDNNPLGAKGIGEVGTTGSWAAVQNAVNDALAPFGVVHLDPPYTPQRVWTAINEHSADQPTSPG